MSSDMAMAAWIEMDDDLPGTASWPAGDDGYHAVLRGAVAPEYRDLAPEELDALVADVLATLPAEDAEGFGSFLGKIGRAVAPIAAKVLPVAAPLVGTAIGGPAGAAIGGTIGRFAGQALGGAPAPLPAPLAAMAPAPVAPPPIAAPVAAPPQAVAGGAGGSAISQLLSLLNDPALAQSVAGQLLGGVGARTVPVGANGVPAPFAAFMNALSVLAGQAATEAAERYGEADEAESTDYLRDELGSFVYDPAVAEERAAALLAQLRSGEAASSRAHATSNGASNGAANGAVAAWLARAGLVQ
jgi:hypothetical protein